MDLIQFTVLSQQEMVKYEEGGEIWETVDEPEMQTT